MVDLKRILITFLMLFCANFAYADSCIVISDMPITDIQCEDESVINVRSLVTLTNSRTSLIITSLKDGSTRFTLGIKNKPHVYKVNVQGGKIVVDGDNSIKVMPIDLPAEVLDGGSEEN